MLIRKWILWGFFGLLGLNVIAGCYGLAITSEAVFAPAIVSSIIVAVACLLLYPASWLSLLKHGKDASWVAIGLIVIECLLGVMLCWLVDRRSLGFTYRHTEFVLVLLITLFPSGLVLMIAAYLLNFSHLKLAARILIATVVIFLVLFTSGLYFEQILRDYRFGERLLVSSGLGACVGIGFSILMAGRWRWFKAVAILAAVYVVMLLMMDLMRVRTLSTNQAWQVSVTASLAIILAYYNLLFMLPLKDTWAKLTRLAAIGIVLLGDMGLVVMSIMLRQLNGKQEDAIVMFVGMLGFIAVCLTFVICFKSAADVIKIRRNDLPSHFNYTQLQIHCPHCQTMQLLTGTDQSCMTCGLKFHFRISEPHCEKCEYLLIGQSSGTCPECGHPVSQVSGQAIGSV